MPTHDIAVIPGDGIGREDGLDQLLERDAILLGAVGDPRVPDHLSLWGLLIPIRRTFDQYLNLRPVRLFPGVRSPLADPQGLDVVIVRENVEGEYSEATRCRSGTRSSARWPRATPGSTCARST
jgi:tartrate dehydrogenase/decarboxylase/D-malate dehydrogenase